MRTTRDRYALAEVAPGGLLLDCKSGVLMHLNAAAVFAWRLHLAGEMFDSIVTAFSERFHLPRETARRDIDTTLREAAAVPPPAASSGEFLYQRNRDGYVFSRNGEPLFLVDNVGDTLSISSTHNLTDQQIRNFLFGLSPKLLALRGHTVLHSSAVEVGGGVVAFLGQSGAGKTTTARALVTSGAALIAEDKLLVKVGRWGVEALSTGEAAVRRWVDQAAAALSVHGSVTCHTLETLDSGPAIPLREIGFLSDSRRDPSGRRIESRRLTPLDQAGAVFSNSFHGSDERMAWEQRLGICATLGRTVPGYELTPPDGLAHLKEAAAMALADGTLRSR